MISRSDSSRLAALLASGGVLLVLCLGIGGPLLALVGAMYVVPFSLLLAHRRSARWVRHKLVASWLVAVALWILLLGGVDSTTPAVAMAIGTLIGSIAWLVWQGLAFLFLNHGRRPVSGVEAAPR